MLGCFVVKVGLGREVDKKLSQILLQRFQMRERVYFQWQGKSFSRKQLHIFFSFFKQFTNSRPMGSCRTVMSNMAALPFFHSLCLSSLPHSTVFFLFVLFFNPLHSKRSLFLLLPLVGSPCPQVVRALAAQVSGTMTQPAFGKPCKMCEESGKWPGPSPSPRVSQNDSTTVIWAGLDKLNGAQVTSSVGKVLCQGASQGAVRLHVCAE